MKIVKREKTIIIERRSDFLALIGYMSKIVKPHVFWSEKTSVVISLHPYLIIAFLQTYLFFASQLVNFCCLFSVSVTQASSESEDKLTDKGSLLCSPIQ